MRYNKFKLILIFSVVLILSVINLTPLISGNIQKNNYSTSSIKSNLCSMSNNSLLAYWSLDEGTGTIAHDYSGHGLDGIINGATWIYGYSGYALNFDGSLDYIQLDEHSEELGFNKTDDYKISAWIKTVPNHSGIIYMISDESDPIPVLYIKILDNGTIEMKVQSTSSCVIKINSEDSYNDGLWHFIEGIYHGNEEYPDIELYIDNEFVASGSDWLCPLGNIQFKKAKIGIASYDYLDMYEGIIDEVKVFKIPDGNIPPSPPNISGMLYGTVGEKYTYTFIPTDPEGDDLNLWVDWGDNTDTGWIGPYNSGEEVKLNHTWSENGTYKINATARDPFDIGESSILLVAMGNIAPNKPIITGPISGNKDELFEYIFVTTDLNNDNVKYYIDWGDGNTEWTNFYPSGEKVKVQHKWSETGIYTITSKAKDNLNAESEPSDPYTLTISEKTMIIGLISNLSLEGDFITLNTKILIYTSLKPINTKFLLSGEKILISNDYLGKISNKFIYGIFNSVIL